MTDFLLYHMPHFTLAGFVAALLSFVGFCSVLTIVLSVIEGWARQWFPTSKFAFFMSSFTDLVSKFGALNLRNSIVKPQWDGQDRRGERPQLTNDELKITPEPKP